MDTKIKRYTHIDDLRGNEGEDPATLAICAVLDTSPNYPANARIAVGSSRDSESDIGGFSCGPVGAARIAATLIDAAIDVETAHGRDPRDLRTARRFIADWLISETS